MSPSTQSKQPSNPNDFQSLRRRAVVRRRAHSIDQRLVQGALVEVLLLRAPLLREQRSGDGRDRDLQSVMLLEELDSLANMVPCCPQHRGSVNEACSRCEYL